MPPPEGPAFVLASASPRRRELLAQLGYRFEVAAVDIAETPREGECGEDYVRRLATEKARAGHRQAVARGCLLPVLGADTEVVVDGRILGKPADLSAALAMLGSLQGRTHQVLSAVAVNDGRREGVVCNVTQVRFRPIDTAEMRAYWESGEPRDKAGGYAIQGRGAAFVEHLEGSYSGVVGLPLFETAELLRDFGVADWRRECAAAHE
jgi:septum formation protein